LPLEGAVTFSPPLACEKAGRIIRCPMLRLCVTDESAIIVTFEMLVASAVPTKNDWP
jgi:hypothetical protein